MQPENFIELYQNALRSQDWNVVEPLISNGAVITFSDGSVHLGKDKISIAFQRNFSLIKNETFKIENVKWIKKKDNLAVYVFQFEWSGFVNNKLKSGEGIGTTTIIKESQNWQLLSEHLGPKSK